MTVAFADNSTAFRTQWHIYHIRDKQSRIVVSFWQQKRAMGQLELNASPLLGRDGRQRRAGIGLQFSIIRLVLHRAFGQKHRCCDWPIAHAIGD
jgi:hypothetical protein